MCWKVLTLKLYFVINPVCVGAWVVVRLCHAPDCSLCLCACKDAMCLSMLTSQGCRSSLMLLLVLTKPASVCVPESAQNFLVLLCFDWIFPGPRRLCVKSGYGCGRVGVLLPSITILRQLTTFSHARWRGVTVWDWKWFSHDFKDTLLCLRSAERECSSPFSLSFTSEDRSDLHGQYSDFA